MPLLIRTPILSDQGSAVMTSWNRTPNETTWGLKLQQVHGVEDTNLFQAGEMKSDVIEGDMESVTSRRKMTEVRRIISEDYGQNGKSFSFRRKFLD